MKNNYAQKIKISAFIIIPLACLIFFTIAILPKIGLAEEDDLFVDKKGKKIDFTKLYESLEAERKELEKKKSALMEQEKQLKALQSEISKEYKQLMEIRKELEKEFIAKEESANVEIKSIVKLYEAMNPEEAAKAIEKMTIKLAAQLISQMNARKSGKILDAMNTTRVKDITKEMYDKQQKK